MAGSAVGGLCAARPGALSGLVGGKARYTRAREAASRNFERALADHEEAEAGRGRQLQTARAQHARVVLAAQAEAHAHNAAVDELERRFRAGVPEAVEEFFGQVLALSGLPAGFPGEYQVAYRPGPRELVVECRLPPATVVPIIRDYRYVKARGEIDEIPRSLKDIKDLYASVIHQVALRTMRDCFCVAAAEDIVDTVVFNGIVSATSRATGQAEKLHLISAPASRAEFSQLVLDQLDPRGVP